MDEKQEAEDFIGPPLEVTCPRCEGTGRIKAACTYCSGTGLVSTEFGRRVLEFVRRRIDLE